jgi:tetratricopeptide (TPR) repeat protein
LAPKPLRVGETFLLLHLVAQNSSFIAKVRATSSVPQNPFTADTLIEIDRAKRALLHAAGRACRALPETVVASAFDVVLPGELDIEGGSLGLSVCVALASRALDIPPSQDVAASAATRSDGTLLPVLHLPAKLAALSRSWPGVTTVVVAAAQEVPPGIPFEVIRRAHVTEALTDFGFDLTRLPEAPLDRHLVRVSYFATENSRRYGVDAWRRLAWEALESAEALACPEGDAEASMSSRAWAALFMLHAGNVDTAIELARGIPDDIATSMGTDLAAWKKVIEASAMIDHDPEMAIPIASAGLELAIACDAESILGQAIGTHGRALLHAGRAAEAEVQLRKAVEHHATAKLRKEEPRSCTYLATCLRHQGRAADALVVVDEAIKRANDLQRWEVARTTLVFLALEKGRSLLALGDAVGAARCFEFVCREYATDFDYPRPAALRGLAAARRALGDQPTADEMLRRCLQVAWQAPVDIVRRVAAMAVGEALLLDPGETSIPHADLDAAWRSLFPAAREPAAIRDVLSRWVY